MNSFQASVKAKMPAEMRPGNGQRQHDLGQVCQRVAPSTSALSSSSKGIERK